MMTHRTTRFLYILKAKERCNEDEQNKKFDERVQCTLYTHTHKKMQKGSLK